MMLKSKSERKFKPIQTSRVQNGSYTQRQPLRNNFTSARKINQQNPQSSYKIPEKCHHEPPNSKPKLAVNYLTTAPETVITKIADQEPPQLKIENRKEEKNHGRKLEYPQPAYRKGTYHQKQKKSQKLQRVQSATLHSSRHFVDTTKRSRQIKQKQASDEEKMKIVMSYLLDTNEDYLQERSRICNQRARPKEEIFNINLAQTLSTYKDHYPPKQAPYEIEMEPQNQKTSNSFGPRKVCGNSSSIEVHNGKRGPRADLATWPEGFKLQGPIDSTTTYANKYPNHGEFEKMVSIATFNEHPSGLPHKTDSTYQSHYDGKGCPPSKMATWNNLHPYGNDFNPDRGTQYGDKHNKKDRPQIQQWPNYDSKHLIVKGKFTTEYRDRITNEHEHVLNEENACRCKRCSRRNRKRIYQ